MPSPSRSLLCLFLAWVGLFGCRAVEEPELHQEPPRPPASPLRISAEPSDTGIRLPDFAKVAGDVGPSVVGVISTIENEAGRIKGIGSGMIVSVHGEILTNEHVVRRASEIAVQLADHTQVSAEVVFADPLLDLALLQLRGEFASLAPVMFRERDPAPGEWIMAVGQPFGLGDTVTVGVVSGLRRDYGDVGRPPDLDPDGIWSFIQTDASINIGNSGGPLVDPDGKVVGITTAVRQDGQGLAFAVPSAMAIAFIDEVRTYRRMRHTRLGILARDDTEVEGRPSVVRVTRVDPDGPGDRAQLQVDDVVLEIDGEPVSRVSDVAYLTQLAGVGAEVTLTIARGPQLRTSKVVIIPEMAG
ncbi:MAG: trypsin-like peptidase domain-containing protein [Enhygromyxa sp.]